MPSKNDGDLRVKFVMIEDILTEIARVDAIREGIMKEEMDFHEVEATPNREQPIKW